MPPAPSPYGERREASLLLSFLSWALFIIIIVLVVSYFTCLGGSTCRVLRVWKALGGSICRILRVWKVEETLFDILYVVL